MKKVNLIQVLSGAILPVAMGIMMQGCGVAGGDNTGVEYAPDMYVSKGYEPMSQLESKSFQVVTKDGRTVYLTKDGKTMREPVKGTIARDLEYEAKHTMLNNYLEMQTQIGPNDYDSAGKVLKNPVPLTEKSLADGKRLFNINCAHCHGLTGLGDGPVSAKFPKGNIPSYKSDRLKATPEGSMYQVITFGKNLMGPHAYTLTPEQRWEVIHYIHYLQNN